MCGCTQFHSRAFIATTVVALLLSGVGFALIFTLDDPSRITQCARDATCTDAVVSAQPCALVNYTIYGCHVYEYKFGKTCTDLSGDNDYPAYNCYIRTDDAAGAARCIPNAPHAAGLIAALIFLSALALYGLLGVLTSIIFLTLVQNDCKPIY